MADVDSTTKSLVDLAALGITAGLTMHIMDDVMSHGHHVHKKHYDYNPFKTKKLF